MQENKNYILALILLLTVVWGTQAQNASLSGKVTSDNLPVEFVNVYINKARLGAVTGLEGEYVIENIKPGTYQVFVSSMGYKTVKKTVTFKEDENQTINFELEATATGLDEVVISGTMKEVSKLESAVPVEVYAETFFKANPTPSIFESLQNVNGVRPQLNCNVCNTGDIHINGLEGPYTMVLIDGMPIVSGLSTVYGLTGIPQALIERVEVVKGPASTLYGSEAVGGLINIITKKPSSAPVFATEVFATDWGEVNTDIGVKYKLGKKVNSLLGINYFNYQNPIDNNKDGFTDVTLQDRISIFNKISIDRKDNRVFTLAGRYVYEDRWGGQMNWSKPYRGSNQLYGESIYTSRWETFGTYQLPVKEIINLQFSANGHDQNSVYGETWYIASQYIGFGQLTWNKTLGKHDVLAGAAYRYTFYDDNTPATASPTNSVNQPSKTHLPGLFIQDEIALNQKNKLLLGARYDYNSLHGDIVTPRINYKWTSANKKNVLRVSAGNGYRVANVFTEDHAALTGARTVEFVGELKPETSWNGNLNFVKKIYGKKGLFVWMRVLFILTLITGYYQITKQILTKLYIVTWMVTRYQKEFP